MPASQLPEVPPETKDWTWVLQQRCPQCSLDAGVLTLAEIPAVIRAQVQVWPVVLLRADVRDRPQPQVWSPLEYGAHTRDALGLFTDRLALILTEDEPTFPDWDPNEAALAGRYHELDPEAVSAEILAAAETLAAAAEAVPPEAVQRRGLRSDGAPFTVTTLLQYLVHDLVHHLWDVSGELPGASAEAPAAEAAAEAVQVTRPRAEVLGEVRPSGAMPDGGASGGEDPAPGAVAAQAGSVPGGAGAQEAEANASAEEADAPASAEAAPTEAEDRPVPPLQAFAHRHRRALGILIAIVCAALAVAFATVAAPTTTGGGVRAFLVHWTVPAIWALIGAVAITWALSVRRQIINVIAYAAVACWVIYLAARML
ncbi:DinB family protein [Ruania zhangjianzhongii]|uniref:DinB family protein n=1 Tax=Ruania zhangjianzhongii TaxID=2603206 RepID=UPI0011CB94B0|nr:DinB family protein [Ruania zhangjianzhongii]